MTPPRYIVPEQMCFITAKAVGDTYQFLPTELVVKVIAYVFAVAIEKFGMRCHEVLFMSNHFHVLLTDVDGRLPAFMTYLDSMLARSLNALRGRRGSVFEKHYNLVVTTDPDKILEHAVYALANPCDADLVRRSAQWKGFSSLTMRYGEPVTIERPKVGLWKPKLEEDRPGRSKKRASRRGKKSKLPDRVQFTLHRPPIFVDELTDDELRDEVLHRVRKCEKKLDKLRAREGRTVMGMASVLEQAWWQFPQTDDKLMTTTPSVSGREEVRREGIRRKTEFEQRYYAALAAYDAGNKQVEWPYGTWLMKQRHRCPCATAPP